MINRQLKYISWLLAALSLMGATPPYNDPTRPPLVASLPGGTIDAKIPTTLLLTAIYIYPNTRFAIINDNVLSLGDHLGEYTITRIEANTVVLEGPQNSTQELTLYTAVKSSSK